MNELDDEAAYITFKNAKRDNLSAAEILAWFGPTTTARLGMRWQAEQAIVRIRAIAKELNGSLSKAETRELPHSYSEPIDMDCDVCHRKHCHGHAQERFDR